MDIISMATIAEVPTQDADVEDLAARCVPYRRD
jgi:hypothetical protein